MLFTSDPPTRPTFSNLKFILLSTEQQFVSKVFPWFRPTFLSERVETTPRSVDDCYPRNNIHATNQLKHSPVEPFLKFLLRCVHQGLSCPTFMQATAVLQPAVRSSISVQSVLNFFLYHFGSCALKCPFVSKFTTNENVCSSTKDLYGRRI